MRNLRLFSLTVAGAAMALAACGGRVPAVSADRESGQSGLMDRTFAGKNKCNPTAHERPFVIEWDATDSSSFEGRAASDVVVVKYVGCSLEILDGCADESIRGAFGTYRPIEWTSGSVEKIDITNEAELVAKLPLGVASFEARVAAGERFHMEYLVAGVRTSTRSAVRRRDLARVPACAGATHFVYGYNLGAFALGSAKNLDGQLGGGAATVSAGGKSSFASSAEKRGGLLDTCRGQSAREVATCKTPVRLSLRAISEDDAAVAPPPPQSAPNDGRANRRLDDADRAYALFESAKEKWLARDGRGCIADLDARDRIDPKSISSEPRSSLASMRAMCLMLAGQCDAGRLLDRKVTAVISSAMSAADVDRAVDSHAASYCAAHGAALKPRDRALGYANDLNRSNSEDVPAGRCLEAVRGLRELQPQLGSAADLEGAFRSLGNGPHCLAKAGDCANAWKVYREGGGGTPREFDAQFPSCARKYAPDATATAEARSADRAEAERESLGNALKRMTAKDPRCLADLDTFDGVTSGPKTTRPDSPYATSRATCLMLAGRCDEGASLLKRVLAAKGNPPATGDAYARSFQTQFCRK